MGVEVTAWGGGSLGIGLVLTWEFLNIVSGRKVCTLMRDRRLVGPEEPLDLVRLRRLGWHKACRSTSSLEDWRGEFPTSVSKRSELEHSHTLVKVGGIIRSGTHPTRYICFPCRLTKVMIAYGDMVNDRLILCRVSCS